MNNLKEMEKFAKNFADNLDNMSESEIAKSRAKLAGMLAVNVKRKGVDNFLTTLCREYYYDRESNRYFIDTHKDGNIIAVNADTLGCVTLKAEQKMWEFKKRTIVSERVIINQDVLDFCLKNYKEHQNLIKEDAEDKQLFSKDVMFDFKDIQSRHTIGAYKVLFYSHDNDTFYININGEFFDVDTSGYNLLKQGITQEYLDSADDDTIIKIIGCIFLSLVLPVIKALELGLLKTSYSEADKINVKNKEKSSRINNNFKSRGNIRKTLKVSGNYKEKIELLKITSEKISESIKQREHMRIGHWRHYKNGHKVFINSYIAGDSRLGIITKDYQLKA